MGDMPATQWVALFLGVLLAVLTTIRAPAAVRGHNVNMLVAHALVTVIILLAVDPVYQWVDRLLGGENVTNLISHLCFPLVFLFGGRQIAKGMGRPDLKKRLVNWVGLTIMGISVVVTVLAFVSMSGGESSMGLGTFEGEPELILYKAASYLYCAWVGATLSRPLFREASVNRQDRLFYASQIGLGTAMGAIALLPFAHLLELVIPVVAHPVAEVLVYGGILLAAVSTGMTFLARRRQLRRLRPSPSARSVR